MIANIDREVLSSFDLATGLLQKHKKDYFSNENAIRVAEDIEVIITGQDLYQLLKTNPWAKILGSRFYDIASSISIPLI